MMHANMAMDAKKLRFFTGSTLLSLALLSPVTTSAGPGELSDVPLFLTNPVEPNILFLLDDSGSMDWGMQTNENNGVMHVSCNYHYALPGPDNNSWYYVAPSEEALEEEDVSAPYRGVWRAWNAQYNRIYYDPTVTYTPWPGEDSEGDLYTNADPEDARYDPYDPDVGTLDLTEELDYDTRWCNDDVGSLEVEDFYPAHYYTWDDTDGDGVVDATDGRTKVEIKASTPAYTSGPDRTDCVAAPVCTYLEEIQNFANWFSYYRKRESVAKAAYGQVIADSGNSRMGLVTLHDNEDANTEIEQMNEDPRDGKKADLLDALYRMQGNGGTPLRDAFNESGKYLSCESNDFFGKCPALEEDEGGACQQNFAVVMTDGYYNGSMSSTVGNADGDDNTQWDSGTAGPYGDSQSNTLGDIAMTYYENDIHPDVDNDLNPVPGGIDDNTAQHVVTYSVAFGVEGSVNSMPPRNDDPFAWPAPTNASGKIDDLRHAAFNGRGGYFSAQSPQQLITGIDGALRSIQARIGSAASVAFNTGSLSTNSELYISLFNSQRWNGDLLSYDLDPSSGAISNSANWSAGTRLDARALGMSPRTLLTYDGTDGIALQWDELTTEQKNDFRTDPDGDRDTAASGMARLDFFRGARSCELSAAGTCSYSDGINTFDTKSFRERSSRLGDIVHSGPVFVGAPESNWPDVPPFPSSAGETYTEFRNDSASRPGVIYVGSNDGMLHGFAKSTGAELLGYVPNVLFSDNSAEGLHYLSDPAFTHRYTVDLTPSIADAYIRTQTGGTTSWKTVLVGGLRGGGRGVYALDVTDPAQFSESGAYPAKTVMWEFSSDDDSDLGYTFSRPSIVPLEDSGNTIRWAVVMGNGYNDLGSGEAKLFILFIEEGLDGTWSGSDYVEISTEVGDSSDRNGLATPAVVDTDGDGLADRVYAGDLFGNMWAFDLSGSNDGNWDVAFKDGGNPQPLFAAEDGQQITTAPVIVRNDVIPTSNSNSPNTLVIFGTGQYLTADDIETDDQQSIYGIWDAGTGGLDKGDLVEQKIDTGSTSEGVPGRTLTDKAIDFEDDYGWYMKLPDPGERQVTDAVIRGDLVYFNTMIPDTDPCSFGGSGWLMVAKWLNGGRVDQVAFDLNNDALMNDADEIDGEPAAGMALQGIATSPVMLSGKRYTSTTETTGGGTVEMTDIIESGGPRTGRLSWEELTP